MTIPVELTHKALAMRSVGATYALITASTGISISSLQNLFRRLELEKGDVTQELLKRARCDLMNDAELSSMMKLELKVLVMTEIAIAKRLFDSASVTIEQLDSIQPLPRAKALSSVAATVISASNLMRKSLCEVELESVELPTLSIRKMTDDEENSLKASREVVVSSPSNGEEIEIVIEELS
jgi:hypothetical protein